MARRGTTSDKGRLLHTYANRAACRACPLRPQCTQGVYRWLKRWEHEDRIERMESAMAADPQKLARRAGLIEHCWSALKTTLCGGFIVRGLEQVGAEVSLAHLAYNLKRALAVAGIKKMLAAANGL